MILRNCAHPRPAAGRGPPLFYIFQLAYRHFICRTFFCLVFSCFLYIFPALDTSPDQNMSSYGEGGRVTGVPAPADAWYVVGFSIGPVHRQQQIRDFSSKRSFPVDRRLADISVQKNLVYRSRVLFFTGTESSSSSTNFSSLAKTESTSLLCFSS